MTLSTLEAAPSGTTTRFRSTTRSTGTPGITGEPSAAADVARALTGRTGSSALRSLVLGALGLLSVIGIATVPVACSSGGVGDPCTPEDEYNAGFSGFTVDLDNIESRSFQCSTRLCLVNHFQGRVSCPLGQAAPTACDPDATPTGCSGSTPCALSQIFAPSCVLCAAGDTTCDSVPCPDGLSCKADTGSTGSGTCVCSGSSSTPQVIDGVEYFCRPSSSPSGFSLDVLQSFICHDKNNCQTVADGATAANNGKDCCVPGTDNPVGVPVCGQCTTQTQRDANDSVYCSCRCCAPCCSDLTLSDTAAAAAGCSTDLSTCGAGNPTGSKCDPNFNFCDCPGGFSCTGIRPNVGLGDAQLSGAYCVKNDTAYTGQPASCTDLTGYGGTGSTTATGTGITCQGTPSTP